MRSALALVLVARTAAAGPTQAGWLPATETIQNDAIAVEGSVYERDDLQPMHERTTALVIAPVLGVSDRTEIALPFELAESSALDMEPGTRLSRFGIELRKRFAPRKATWTPLLRVGAFRDTLIRTELRLDVDLAVTYRRDRIAIEAAAGLASEINLGAPHEVGRFGVGASYQLRRVRAGVEFYAELSDGAGSSWAAAGPTLAVIRKRFWVTGALGLGIANIHASPRINWGMTW
jgi:hypothetical protein